MTPLTRALATLGVPPFRRRLLRLSPIGRYGVSGATSPIETRQILYKPFDPPIEAKSTGSKRESLITGPDHRDVAMESFS